VTGSIARFTLILGVALLAAACSSASGGSSNATGDGATQTASTPAAVSTVILPPLTPQGGNGQPVDGVQCLATEQLAYHIHAHLSLLVDGASVYIPAGIGITPPRQVENGFVVGGSCFYWLHTPDVTGVIHIESPTSQLYTLGQFFAIWGEPISTSQVATFPVTDAEPLHVFVNGNPYSGDPAQIQLDAHTLVTLEVGTQVPPPPFTFPSGL
jgi:hypothetical protein